MLRIGIALLCRLSEPFYSLFVVLRDAFIASIKDSQIKLRRDMTLLGGFSVPLYGLFVVLWEVFTFLVETS